MRKRAAPSICAPPSSSILPQPPTVAFVAMSFFRGQPDVETRLCTAVNVAIQAGDPHQLQSIVLLEPGEGNVFPPDHQELIQSLQQNYPANNEQSEKRLEDLVRRVVTETAESEDEEGRPIQSWGSLVTFLVGWMTFLRDMDAENLVLIFELMTDLQSYVDGSDHQSTSC